MIHVAIIGSLYKREIVSTSFNVFYHRKTRSIVERLDMTAYTIKRPHNKFFRNVSQQHEAPHMYNTKHFPVIIWLLFSKNNCIISYLKNDRITSQRNLGVVWSWKNFYIRSRAGYHWAMEPLRGKHIIKQCIKMAWLILFTREKTFHHYPTTCTVK